jgi:D-alanyl-D-alanine carboxypeptidase/D-alanyl-D-alanine-endopeptidase (penicillin-binding protein 4)
VPPIPQAHVLATRLRPLLRAPGLGPQVRAEVVDAVSGDRLFAAAAQRPVPPASTAKLLTAAALLTVRPPTYRIITTVRAGSGGTITLVGGGDPTISGAPRGKPTAYPEAARLTDLADQILRAHVPVRRIVVDDALFTGPAISPAWAPGDVPSSYASAITAVMADGGRAAPADAVRSATPDLAAGHELAAALHEPNLPVSRATTGTGRVVARVESAPLSVLIEQMLQESDNVIAECLARQVAIARHEPASFTGAAAAIRQVLHGLHLSVGSGMVDGSGLAARDRLSVATLADVLETVIARPSLHPVLAGLPVAGWSGTLDTRYLSGRARAGAGVVRAKTGTLTGVSALAGVVHDASGRLLVFAFDADRVQSTTAADAALDDLAAALARCGCG